MMVFRDGGHPDQTIAMPSQEKPFGGLIEWTMGPNAIKVCDPPETFSASFGYEVRDRRVQRCDRGLLDPK
jgi:hypothetical protein